MVIRQVGFIIVMETMAAVVVAPEDLLCSMMMMSPLMMPFVQGVLFSICLVNFARDSVSMLLGASLL
jgi:ABC-type thiamin/hydroxymethylpyrimidine transport system permease subunit